jgi:hypothetical protein
MLQYEFQKISDNSYQTIRHRTAEEVTISYLVTISYIFRPHSSLVEKQARRFFGRLGQWFRMQPLEVIRTEQTSVQLKVALRAITCALPFQ